MVLRGPILKRTALARYNVLLVKPTAFKTYNFAKCSFQNIQPLKPTAFKTDNYMQRLKPTAFKNRQQAQPTTYKLLQFETYSFATTLMQYAALATNSSYRFESTALATVLLQIISSRRHCLQHCGPYRNAASRGGAGNRHRPPHPGIRSTLVSFWPRTTNC